MTPRASKFCWKMNEFRLSAVRQRHLADERYYYWDREYTSLSSVHLPTEFWRPWWRLPRSTSKCKIGFGGLTAETFWFDPNWSILWRVMTLAEMECSKKKNDKPLNYLWYRCLCSRARARGARFFWKFCPNICRGNMQQLPLHSTLDQILAAGRHDL